MPDDDEENDDWALALSGQKKKKKKKNQQQPLLPETEGEREFTYFELLQRLYTTHRERVPEEEVDRRFVLPVPQMARQGGRHVVLTNFGVLCQRMQRDLVHVQAFLAAETAAATSINGTQGLVLRGRFTSPQMASLLRKYLRDYVQCLTCQRFNTTLVKDPVVRLWLVQCADCQAHRSVTTVKLH